LLLLLHELARTRVSTQELVWLQERRCISAWVDALLVPTNMRAFRVGLGGIRLCSDARWVVEALFRTVSPETRALSRGEEHGLSLRCACESPSRTYRAWPAKIGEFMRHLLRVIGWRVWCSPCAHHLACKKSNNAPGGVCSLRCGHSWSLLRCPRRAPNPTLLSVAFAHDMPRSASAVNIRNS
jgi:hypothetical protein